MGSFFTNLHVRAGKSDRTADAIRPALGTGGALISTSSGGWVTVYPEATEDQDVSRLSALAQRMSRVLETHVYATLVHDSDVFGYWLYESGGRRDRYLSNPEYGGALAEDERLSFRGEPTALLPICQKGITERQVRNILWKGVVFRLNPMNWIFPGDGVAKALAACLGIPRGRALCGFKYAAQGETGEDLSTWLRF